MLGRLISIAPALKTCRFSRGLTRSREHNIVSFNKKELGKSPDHPPLKWGVFNDTGELGANLQKLYNPLIVILPMKYKKEDLVKISWDDFDKYALKIKNEVENYLNKKNIKIDVVVPIFRGGGILALKLAFEFKVIRILPYQYKYFHGEKDFKLKKVYCPKFSQLTTFKKKNPVILVVEGNHSTGRIANLVISDIKKQLPNSKIIYVSLAKDYFYKDSVKNIDFTTCGYYTNENRKLSKEACKKIGINFENVYIFPWESYEEELAMLNNDNFGYENQEEF
jgi:hypoxanthine phosphoribosyltransferase